MPSVARFFAAQVLLSNYDGILFNGQNFLMTLAPETHLISFAPWDLDHCWGEFPLTGSPSERIHASIREPWIGEQFFVERLFESILFQELYLEALQNQLNTSFKTEHWSEVMDGLAPMLRPVIAHEPALPTPLKSPNRQSLSRRNPSTTQWTPTVQSTKSRFSFPSAANRF